MADKRKDESLDAAVKQVFSVQCKGRDGRQNPCLDLSVPVEVTASQLTGSTMISLNAKCPYLCGRNNNNCRAMKTQGIVFPSMAICPYSINLPWAIDNEYGEQD